MKSKILVLSILLTVALSLHSSHKQQSNLNQTATIDDAIKGFIALEEQAAANTQNSTTITGHDQLVTYLETVIKSQLQDLYLFESSLIPVVSLNPDACATLTDSNRSSLVQKVEVAQANVKKLVDDVDGIDNATLREDLLRRSSLQYAYLEQVKLGLKRQCQQKTTISTTTYFYNLESKNWIYGSDVQPSDLTELYFSLTTHGTVTVCPSTAPFVTAGGVSCFNCNGSTPIFDLTEQVCVNCPANTTLNTTSHQCACPCDCYVSSTGNCVPRIPVYQNGNFQDIAGLTDQSILTYSSNLNKTLANPSASPRTCAANQFSTITSCITCPLGTYFIVDELKCAACTSLSSSHVCNSTASTNPTGSTGTPNSQNSQALNRIITIDASKLQKNGIPCPDSTPFYTGVQPSLCIQCPVYFDWDRKVCASCPVGSTLSNYHCV